MAELVTVNIVDASGTKLRDQPPFKLPVTSNQLIDTFKSKGDGVGYLLDVDGCEVPLGMDMKAGNYQYRVTAAQAPVPPAGEGRDTGRDPAVPEEVLKHARLCVSRLLRLGETIGTAFRLEVTHRGTSDMVVTALHCVEEDGACLDNLMAFGGPLAFLFACPDLDVCFFRGPSGPALAMPVLPVTVCAPVSLFSFPQAVDQDLRPDTGPTVTSGQISQVSRSGFYAAANYSGSMPNCSGGAVVLHSGELAGVHVSISYHLDNSKHSIASGGGSVHSSGSGGSSDDRDNSMLSIERDPAHLSMPPSSEEEDAPDIETSAQVAYANIGHKGYLAVIVSASALDQCMQRAGLLGPETLRVLVQEGRRRGTKRHKPGAGGTEGQVQ